MRNIFFSLLFPEDENYGLIEIREIDSLTNDANVKTFRSVKELSLYTPPEDKNVYFGVYKRGFRNSGKAENCKFTNVLFLDFDKMTLPGINLKLAKANLPKPSIIVASGNGYHIYWLLSKPAYDVTNLLKQMATITGADIKSTDKARILRFPGTFNHKYKPANKCEIYSINDKKHSIELFQRLFPDKPVKKSKIKFPLTGRPCIDNILKGVREGQRNFALGRITKYFHQQGKTKQQTKELIIEWNTLCDPPERFKALFDSFKSYWYGNYQLLGCVTRNEFLQSNLSDFCDKDRCNIHKNWPNKLTFDKACDINNRFLKFRYITGYEIALYGILAKHPEGLNTSQIQNKLVGSSGNSIGEKTLSISLNSLIIKKFINVMKASRRTGKENFYYMNRQQTFNTGFTLLSYGSILGFIDKRITADQLKIYTYLNKFYCEGKTLPSITRMSVEFNIRSENLSQQFRKLEQAEYIKRQYVYTKKGQERLICHLLV